jgi:flavin-dependent thymidylate synthase
MKVTLINYTPNALDTLIFTKNTRLSMHAGLMEEIAAWPLEKKMAELEYMRNTIASSWEFIDFIFMIEGVSRAFTHQLVRHRVGVAFAQQAQRAVNMTGFEYITGPSIKAGSFNEALYYGTMHSISAAYCELLNSGVNKQDARGILPTNISTNICFKANLRTLSDMGQTRLCTKSQGEFQDVFRAIRDEVIKVYPWTSDFIRVHCAKWGVCKFPTYVGCPVKDIVYNPDTGLAYGGGAPAKPDEIQIVWEHKRGEAQP